MNPVGKRARRLAAAPVPAAMDVIARGGAAKSSRRQLEPVLAEMVQAWWAPSQPERARGASSGIVKLLDWLEDQRGDNWQARWVSSGADLHPRTWPDLVGFKTEAEVRAAELAVNALVVLRGIAPTLRWLLGMSRFRLQDDWTIHHDSAVFAALRVKLNADDSTDRGDTIGHLFRLSVTAGRDLSALASADFRAGHDALVRTGRRRNLDAAWRHMHQVGLLEGEPKELWQVRAKPRLTPPELVERYGVRDDDIRGLLVEYLTEREASCDYTTLKTTALHVVNLFWVDLEAHEPALRTLNMSTEQIRAWKQRLKTLESGKPRTDWPTVIRSVRSFYLDLAAWAQDDPARWARWVAPCPISNRELRILAPRRRRRQIAKMNARTRALSPVLPQLVSSVAAQLRLAERRLIAASATDPGGAFTVTDEHWRRSPTPSRKTRFYQESDITAIDCTGRRVDLSKAEDRAFWTWAVVEVLRHTGVRIEELLELTHLSLRPFRKPDGQIIPLLQIAPSKTDAERILPVGPELAHVLSRIVVRILGTKPDLVPDSSAPAPTVPLVSRWDGHERVHSPPLPYLFQRSFLIGRRSVISPGTVRNWLVAAAANARLCDVDGTALAFSPHDFRRVFLTDAVRNGLPIHIAAQLAGHDDLNTTRRYAATYPTEVIEHYQQFLARRRAERPVEEYRQPTTEELDEFGEHFGRRRVELGNCVRPYGTGCTHEHACVRCSFLQVDPAQSDRLTLIETDLNARIATARDNAWIGDVEQLQLTLGHLHDKQDQLRRFLERLPAAPLITAAPTLTT